MAGNKKKNFDKLFKSLRDAGWIMSHSQDIYDAIADAYLATHPDQSSYADYLDSLSPLAYQDELEKNVRPFVKRMALKLSRDNRGTDYDRENLRNFLRSTAGGIDREKFLNILGRKAEEYEDENGNKVKKDRHIGALTDEDYDNLYIEGYDRDFVDELANRYRNEYIRANAEKVLAGREKALKDAREKVVKEYNKHPLSGTLKVVAPELYAEGVRAMSEGTDIPGDKMGRAVAMDVGRNAGLVASAAMPNPFLTGAGVFGTEMAFNGASPNYRQDPSQAAMAGVAAGTIPSILNKAMSGLQRVPVKPLQNAVRTAAKKLKRGENSPARQEAVDKMNFVDNAIDTYIASKTVGSGVRTEDARKVVAELTDRMNDSYMAVTYGTAGKWNQANVMNMLETPEGQQVIRDYITKAPTRDIYVNHTDVVKLPKSLADEDEFAIRSASEQWLDAAQKQWPVTTGEFVAMPIGARQRMLNWGTEAVLGGLNNVGGVIEPASTRIGSPLPYGRADNGGLILIEDWRREHGNE